MKHRFMRLGILASLILAWAFTTAAADVPPSRHVWEKVEITLTARNKIENPYTDATVWVDLTGPGFSKRCYGFWDGGNTFKVRVMATRPGEWTWKSGSKPADPGLEGVSGTFSATDWTEADKSENPNRRGMIQPTKNGHAFDYADGTPFFWVGDTWWAASTWRFRWNEDDAPRPMGPEAGFKDYVALRKKQHYNGVSMLAAFPNWDNDDKKPILSSDEKVILRSAWKQAGTNSAKMMADESGNRAFMLPGKVPGLEKYFPDLDRINPAYFQSLDKKIDYLNAQGFVPFLEVARRDIGQGWKKYYGWPDSYSRYIQYIWSRYQANICFLSTIHYDSAGETIPAADWNAAANKVIDDFGKPPFGSLVSTDSAGSTLKNWGQTDKARWLTFHQIGNLRRHDSDALLTDIFKAEPPIPGVNGEPYYDGMENKKGGSEEAAAYCRSAMYGSVLSGGLGGHVYGAGGWNGGFWSGEREEASDYRMWEVAMWPSADQMRHLKTFILSEGATYQNLIPGTDQVSPNQSAGGSVLGGWAFAAATGDEKLILVYFEKDSPMATYSGAKASGRYTASWFDPRSGKWIDVSGGVSADAAGKIAMPKFPDQTEKSDQDWCLS